MELDDQLHRYFGTTDLSAVPPQAIAAASERMRVDLGMETDPRHRFAIWSLMHILGVAPDLDVAFKTDNERAAARKFMELLEHAGEQSADPDPTV